MSEAQTEKQPVDPAAPGESVENAGVAAIRAALKTLPGAPGVYRMISADDSVLYVGKAKNLKKRVASYTNLSRQSLRIARMINRTRAMEFVTTHTEAEALLLEANLIKRLAPHYNILLRDDKSFPYILVTGDHDFPQVLKYRGARNRAGQYFGPFASAGAVNQSLAVLQRAFLLRPCSNAVIDARTRPCLLHQRVEADIQRLRAPADLDDLSGRPNRLQRQLQGRRNAGRINYYINTTSVSKLADMFFDTTVQGCIRANPPSQVQPGRIRRQAGHYQVPCPTQLRHDGA